MKTHFKNTREDTLKSISVIFEREVKYTPPIENRVQLENPLDPDRTD